MIIKKKQMFSFLILMVLLPSMIPTAFAQSANFFNYRSAGGANSYSGYYSSQSRPTLNTLYGSDVSTYWPVLGDRATCDARNDLLLSVAPAGCTPSVVRSDLLAEQNVAVFCQIDSYKINPLVDVNQVRNIRFLGDYPQDVVGVGFHPARAALRSQERILGSPLANNIGYAVIVLKRQPNESLLPDSVQVNLSAQIDYIAGNSLGVGSSEFLLNTMTESEWELEKSKQSFWNGRYYVRLEEVDSNFATITIYDGNLRYATQRIERGRPSSEIFVPGLYCRAGLQISYDGFVSADKKARIEVITDGASDVFEVTEGSRFLDNRCSVRSISVNSDGETGRVVAQCGGRNVELQISGRGVTGENITIIGVSAKPVLKGNSYEVDFSNSSLIQSLRTIYLFEENDVLSMRLDSEFVPVVSSSGVFVEDSGAFNEPTKSFFAELWTKMKEYRAVNSVSATSTRTGEEWKYFDEAIKNYERVAIDFPAERRDSNSGTPTFGEDSLRQAISLASEFGADDVERRLINTFREIYPSSDYADSYLLRLNELGKLDFQKAGEAVSFEDRTRVVRLLGVSEPKNTSFAELRVSGQRFDLKLRERRPIPFEGQNSNGEILLESLTTNEARISAYCRNEQGVISTNRQLYSLRAGDVSTLVCGLEMSLSKANTQQVAKIRLNPIAQGTESLSNFTVNIGIEKRAIQISPDKAREKIENLNKSIEDWEGISDKLGNVVTGLKSACFATSALLSFKNFASGLNGETLARQQVMNGDSGWKARCADKVAAGEFPTLDACYSSNAGAINSEVSAHVNAINKVNAQIQDVQSRHKNQVDGLSGIFGDSVDSEAVRKELAEKVRAEYGDIQLNLTGLRKSWLGQDNQSIESISVAEVLSPGNVQNNVVSTEAMKEIMLNAELKKRGVQGEHLKNVDSSLVKVADRINENRIISSEVNRRDELVGQGFASPLVISPENFGEKSLNVRAVSNDIASQYGFGELKHTSTVVVPGISSLDSQQSIEPGTYVLGLKEADSLSGTYVIDKVWNQKTKEQVNASSFSTLYRIGVVKASDRTSLNNQIVNADRTCHFYETEPYKGMPAIIPFDQVQGWYAATRQTLPVFGGIGAFDASGRVTSFWLCNVGENGRIEFNSGFGDDLCQQINLNTGQPLGSFPGLSESEARGRINQAVRAIEDAARQYPNNFITVNGQRCEVGKPAVDSPQTQCQDFMSPSDCQILFNVCDPVVCPSSRCDFGGTYPVANVAQTGIVGSTLLCLPNIREGIVIPVCLTGIQAGIDGWVSIMRNYRDCLQENVDSGETVGICDQIHSIYLCEFFWGQVAPFVNVLIPKLLEMSYGQGVRGGSEYLTVQSAWQNMQNSINYFTQSYAVNSLNSFQTRTEGQYGNYLYSTASIAEIGTEVCRGFISAKAPKAFESLVQPDSPPQFHAWFDEKTFTTATLPATSHYKVFYHIFAGNDAGVNYQVYLRNPPQDSYYATNPFVVVASGFAPRGDYKSETRDFTAPAGYKELCVRINNDEKCGFAQVSTSFAVNYLRDTYVSGELQKTNIQSEQECISGSHNPASFLTPNLQAGAESFVSPDIYNRGVVRICATENPGKGTNPERFLNVGNCGNPQLGCWLDRTSVDKALTANNVGIRNETLGVLEDRVQEYLESRGDIYTEEIALQELDKLEQKVSKLRGSGNVISEVQSVLNEADLVSSGLFFNSHKARILVIRGQANEIAARHLKVQADEVVRANRPAIADGEFVGHPFISTETEERVITNVQTLDLAISMAEGMNGSYSDNKDFVDELQSSGIITLNEHDYMKEGFLGLTIGNGKQMSELLSILKSKRAVAGIGEISLLRMNISDDGTLYYDGKEREIKFQDSWWQNKVMVGTFVAGSYSKDNNPIKINGVNGFSPSGAGDIGKKRIGDLEYKILKFFDETSVSYNVLKARRVVEMDSSTETGTVPSVPTGEIPIGIYLVDGSGNINYDGEPTGIFVFNNAIYTSGIGEQILVGTIVAGVRINIGELYLSGSDSRIDSMQRCHLGYLHSKFLIGNRVYLSASGGEELRVEECDVPVSSSAKNYEISLLAFYYGNRQVSSLPVGNEDTLILKVEHSCDYALVSSNFIVDNSVSSQQVCGRSFTNNRINGYEDFSMSADCIGKYFVTASCYRENGEMVGSSSTAGLQVVASLEQNPLDN